MKIKSLFSRTLEGKVPGPRREPRRVLFEQMEPRRLLTAQALVMGAVYIEQDVGSDVHGDVIELSFVGGAPGSELERVIIGRTGDNPGIVFDSASGGIGVDQWVTPEIVWAETQTEDATASLLADDGSGQMIVRLSGFQAGDRLRLLVDVDEVEVPAPFNSPDRVNEGLDPITSGLEFQGVELVAEFSADHYQPLQLSGEFVNRYDSLLLDSGLDLPLDNADGLRDRTAGVVVVGRQTEWPVTLAGSVYLDLDADLEREENDTGVEGVRIELWRQFGEYVEASGHVAVTDSEGDYRFGEELGLTPGVYQLREQQPDRLMSLAAIAGSVNGETVGEVLDDNPDVLANIDLLQGDLDGVDFDFVETMPVHLRGRVLLKSDAGGTGVIENMVGVVVQLRDATGQLTAVTTTGPAGDYEFPGMMPGMYSVQQVTPEGVFAGEARLGAVAGESVGRITGSTQLAEIQLAAGDAGHEYNFINLAPTTLSGFVFQDGAVVRVDDQASVGDVREQKDGRRTPDDLPIPGVNLRLYHAQSGSIVVGADLLPGTVTDGPLMVTTDADGHYSFSGLRPGDYTLEQEQPAGWIDGKDHVGTAGGIAISGDARATEIQGRHGDADRIADIHLKPGQDGKEYNFSELHVLVQPPVGPLLPPVEQLPPPPPSVLPPITIPPEFVAVMSRQRPAPTLHRSVLRMQGSSSPATGMSWHLSVINGGQPRWSIQPGAVLPLTPVSEFDTWTHGMADSGAWQLGRLESGRGPVQVVTEMLRLGLVGAVPVAGDFNGDGVSEMGLYHAGRWYLDLNGNGRWDDEDLWAELGQESDMPVVGDWDGDGKDDIGVLGSRQFGDLAASALDPGLPDPANRQSSVPKNIPPLETDASSRRRLMQRSRVGEVRSDVVDHVFQHGGLGDVPVAGDWNGDGVDTIGVFRDGRWILDSNGDGRLGDEDRELVFGEAGDIPLVADWDGDGIDQVGVFRKGHWLVDSNQNGQMDELDHRFDMGDDASRPVSGDWDGDGADDPAIYRRVPGDRTDRAQPDV